jgi:ABC-type branched-subunit amino acid transport system ATPase component
MATQSAGKAALVIEEPNGAGQSPAVAAATAAEEPKGTIRLDMNDILGLKRG